MADFSFLANGVRPVEMPNQMNNMLMMQKLQEAQQQQQMNALAMQDKMQSSQGLAGIRNYMTQNPGADLADPRHQSALYSIDPINAPQIVDKVLNAKKIAADTSQANARAGYFTEDAKKLQYETQKKQQDDAISHIAGLNSREDAIASIVKNMKDNTLPPDKAQAVFNTLPPDDTGMPDWRAKTLRGLLLARDQLEQQFTPTNNGQQSMLMATPKFGGGPAQVVPGSVQQQQMTPSQTEELKVKKAQLALSQQRLTQETATGALSPAALEFAAQLVAQGQPMPSMGMGTTAAKMRAQVLEKAAQIANGPPAGDAPPAGQAAPSGNMADAAGNVIQNRIGYRTAAATQRAFSTGVESRRTTSINALAEHLNTVDGVAEALNNGNVQAFNTIANMIAQQTGQPAPTNLKSVMAIVGPEIIKAIVPSGGGELERRNAETLINQAQSPAQVKGAIAKLKELVGGQLVSLETQYKAGTKKDDFRDTYLTPAAKSAFGTASAKIKGTPTAPSGGVDASNPLLK